MENKDNKFSIIEAYTSLEPFIKYLANRHCNDDLMFSYDELFGELQLELVKGFEYYYTSGKITKIDQLYAVLRKMMDNRIAELRYRHYVTHRGKSKLNISIDVQLSIETDDTDAWESIEDPNAPDPELMAMSVDRVDSVTERLSLPAQKVLNMLLDGSSRLDMLVYLMTFRAVSNHRFPKFRPALVANAMLTDTKSVEKAFKEIKKVYAEVCNGQ